MTRQLDRRPPTYHGDPEESIREILEYLEYMRQNINLILNAYGKRLTPSQTMANNAGATEIYNGGGGT